MSGKRKIRITAYMLFSAVFICSFLNTGRPASAKTVSAEMQMLQGRFYSWGQRISADTTDGEYLTENLGMDKVTRQSVIRTIEENWTEGLKYSEASYSVEHQNTASCVNYGNRQYKGHEQKGYGYNCTGFVASVLYYANGGEEKNACSNMKALYEPLQKRTGSFTNGTGWYNYIASGQKEGSSGTPRTNVYYMGEVTDPDSLQSALSAAESSEYGETEFICLEARIFRSRAEVTCSKEASGSLFSWRNRRRFARRKLQ